MTREQLEHAVRASCDVSGDTEVWVFGSQAILGSFPDAPASLRASIEVDIQPRNCPEKTDAIDGALGELSLFHQTHGFYVHGVSLNSSRFPAGWKDRVCPVRDDVRTRGSTGWCIEAHDLAASKLAAFRDKDRRFVRTLLKNGMIRSGTLLKRITTLDVDRNLRQRLGEWLRLTVEEM